MLAAMASSPTEHTGGLLDCHGLTAGWTPGGAPDGLGSAELVREVESSLKSLMEASDSESSGSSKSSDSSDSSESTDGEGDSAISEEAKLALEASDNTGFLMEQGMSTPSSQRDPATRVYCHSRVTEATKTTGKPEAAVLEMAEMLVPQILSMATEGGQDATVVEAGAVVVHSQSTISAAGVGAAAATPLRVADDLVVLATQRHKWSRVFSREGVRRDPTGYIATGRSLVEGVVEKRLLECLPTQADQGVLTGVDSATEGARPHRALYRPQQHPGAQAVARRCPDPEGRMSQEQIPPVYRVAECFRSGLKSSLCGVTGRAVPASTVLWVSPATAATVVYDETATPSMHLVTGVKHVVSMQNERVHVFDADIDATTRCRQLPSLLGVWRQGAGVSSCVVPGVNWRRQMLHSPECVPITNWWCVTTTTPITPTSLEMVLKPAGLVVPVDPFYAGLVLQARESPLPLQQFQDNLLDRLCEIIEQLATPDLNDLVEFWHISGMVGAAGHREIATVYERASEFAVHVAATRETNDALQRPNRFQQGSDSLPAYHSTIRKLCAAVGPPPASPPLLATGRAEVAGPQGHQSKLSEMEMRISKLEDIIANHAQSMQQVGRVLIGNTTALFRG